MPETDIIRDLIDQLEDTNLVQRVRIKRQLVAIGTAAVDALIETMRHEARYKNWEAASLLGQIPDHRSIEPLLETLVSHNLVLAQVAAEALQSFDLKLYLYELINLLFASHPTVQPLIVGLLEKIGEQEAVPVLIELLVETPAVSVRLAVIRALGNLGSPLAINVIRSFEHDQDTHVCKRVRVALEKLTRKSF